MLLSEGLNPRLIRYSEIGVPRIKSCLVANQPLGCEQGSLEGKVHMVPSPEVATVLKVACTRNSVAPDRRSVLHCQPGREVLQIICVRRICVVLLRDGKCSKVHRQQEELRHVGPDQI